MLFRWRYKQSYQLSQIKLTRYLRHVGAYTSYSTLSGHSQGQPSLWATS